MNEEKDFLEFMTNEKTPSSHLRGKVISMIRDEIKIFKRMTFAKFIMFQSMAALITLLVCPQFGIGPLGGGHGISHVFVNYGQWACAAFCGVFFMGASSGLAYFFLNKGEKAFIFKHQLWLIAMLATAWMMVLMFVGKAFARPMMFETAEFNSIWWLSAVLSSIAFFITAKKVYTFRASLR